MICTDQKLIWPHRSIEWTDANEERGMLVPCGKCIACLMNKRQDWSFRLEQEHRVSKSAHFVTLTYDEKHLRTDRSLCKRDLQLYLKRLRKKDETTRIRYYGVGEYGTKGGRPHYHVLLFNSKELDIRSAWNDIKGEPIGLVHVGKVTAASIAYVTKYVIQRTDYPEGVDRPFSVMSRSYGIGGAYLADNVVEWHRGGDFNYIIRPGNMKGRLPRFYRDKIWYSVADRDRISSAALSLSLVNQIKERDYYALTYGSLGEAALAEARNRVLSRVKQKIKFTQTF